MDNELQRTYKDLIELLEAAPKFWTLSDVEKAEVVRAKIAELEAKEDKHHVNIIRYPLSAFDFEEAKEDKQEQDKEVLGFLTVLSSYSDSRYSIPFPFNYQKLEQAVKDYTERLLADKDKEIEELKSKNFTHN